MHSLSKVKIDIYFLILIGLLSSKTQALYDYHKNDLSGGFISRSGSITTGGMHEGIMFTKSEDTAMSRAMKEFNKSANRYSLAEIFNSFEHSSENRYRNREKYGVSGNCSNSRDIGVDFKFTSLSKDEDLLDFKKSLKSSYLFTFTNLKDGMYSVIMLSLDKDFHPQLRLYKVHVNQPEMYTEIKGKNSDYGKYSSKYYLEKGEYVLEIGLDESIDFFPFKNSTNGRFLCVLSQENKSLQEIITSRKYKVNYEEDMFYVPKNQGEELFDGVRRNELENWNDEDLNITNRNEAKKINKNWGYGAVDYQITPFFNEATGTCEIYSRSKTVEMDNYNATIVKLKCNEKADLNKIFQGQLMFKNFFEFRVDSKSTCDLIDILNK